MTTQNNIAIVTGSNKGIGFAIVKGLCEKYNGIIYLTARDITRGKAALKNLEELGYYPNFHQLDINDQNSVNKFRDYVKVTHGGIDLLINNAAIAYNQDAKEPFADRAEETIKTNYFGLLRMCEAFFPLLKENARVVNVSSSAGHLSRIPSAEIRGKFSSPSLTIPELNHLMNQFINDAKNNTHIENGWGESSYVVSKVGVSALTRIQQNEVKNTNLQNVLINSVHPGYVDTDMTDHKGTLTIEEGAKAPLYLALDNHNLKGEYVWYDCNTVDWLATSTPAKR